MFDEKLRTLSEYFSRLNLGRRLGLSFDDKRDIYVACGWPKNLKYEDFRNVYDRGDIGKTVIVAYPDATWVHPPVIRETEEIDQASTAFEKDILTLSKELPIFSYFNRADILAGIGSFGALFYGFDDGQSFEFPVRKPAKLRYLRPLSEGSMKIKSYEEDVNNPRFGLPVLYDVTFGNFTENFEGESTARRVTLTVHHTRMLHIADHKDESEVFGTPRLQPVYNRLFDAHKVLGCSAEMFWQGAFQGLAFEAEAEGEIVNSEALEEEIQKYVHGLQRYMQLQGIKTKSLSSPVASPKTHIDAQIAFISGTTRIPTRILTGSERGELSSVQDENNWKDRVEERRNRFATDEIIKPFFRDMVAVGAIAAPMKGDNIYSIEWNDISSTTFKQQMETSKLITDALAIYVKDGVYKIMRPDQYLEKVMKFQPDQIQLFLPENLDLVQEAIIADKTVEEETIADRNPDIAV